MTFKDIVNGAIRADAADWVEGLLGDQDISYHWTVADRDDARMEKVRGKPYYSYTVRLTVVLDLTRTAVLSVQGTLDEAGIHRKSIFDEAGKLLWSDSKAVRDSFRIKSLVI